MLPNLLCIILLTEILVPGTEAGLASFVVNAYGHICRKSMYYPITGRMGIHGATVNLAFLVHDDYNIPEKYSQLMKTIIMKSHTYLHEYSFEFRTTRNSNVMERLARYNDVSRIMNDLFNDTSIGRGFLRVEKHVLDYDVSYVPNLCILLTTSPADNKSLATAAATSLLDSGVNIMVVAVGDDVDKDDVKDLASNEKCAFTTGKNMSNSVDDINHHSDEVTGKIERVLMHAHILPKYTRCYEAGYILIITDVDKDPFETLIQLKDFLIDFDSLLVTVSTVMIINSPIDDGIFQEHLSSVEQSVPEVTFEVVDSNYNLTSIIQRGRQVFMDFKNKIEKVIILATNKKIDDLDDVISESQASQKSGVHIMALGIGAEVLEDQLSQIITDPRGIAMVESPKEFTSGLRKVYRKICSGGCHSGWAHYKGMCLVYKSRSEQWLAAQNACRDLRAKLVTITTPEKYAWLKDEFLDKLKKPVHIGLRKYSLKSVPFSSEFRWENGKPLWFSDWNRNKTPGEPDGVSYEKCVAWYPDGWRDVVCEIMIDAGFICEREAYNVTETNLKGAEVLPLWKENVCPVPPKGFDPKEGPILVTGKECRPLLNVHWQPRELKNIYSCSNGEVISEFLLCDGVSHCRDGSDEKRCSEECTKYQFKCANRRCVSLAYFCDYSDDCGDNSDEASCVSPWCGSEHWQCENGQCIPKDARCDLRYDCYDKTDEGDLCSDLCNEVYCNGGTCIPSHWILDDEVDCGGGRAEDEHSHAGRRKNALKVFCYTGRYKELYHLCKRNKILPLSVSIDKQANTTECSLKRVSYHRRITPPFKLWKVRNLFSDFDETPNCTVVYDGFGKHFKSFYNPNEDCRDNNVICPVGFYRCPSSFCIPIEKVCDGVMDCLDGEEETACDKYECPGYYKCPGASYCLHPSRICDWEANCPGGKDELMCGVECPDGCNCSAGVVECRNIVINMTSPFHRSARSVVVKESQVLVPSMVFMGRYFLRQVVLIGVGLQTLNDVFDHQINLINLNISHNTLSEISPLVLSKLENLRILDLSYNPLKRMSEESFAGLKSLQVLYMTHTSIEILDQRLFSPLTELKELDIRGMSVHTIVDEAFYGLGQLKRLHMQGNTITKFGQRVFTGLDRLEELHTDMYSLCCAQVRPFSLSKADCISPETSISSCSDLLASGVLRSSVWLLCIASVVGNIVSTAMRVAWERHSMQNGFGVFVTHLGIADFLMGIYLLIIAVADTLYKGTYIWNDYDWRNSSFCKIAGALSTLSSEASTFFICLITLDRFLVIRFPFASFRFRFTSATAVAVLGWIVAIVIAVVPLIPSLSHWNFYTKNGACLALPFSTERSPGWIYSVAIFTGLNFVTFIVIAAGQYSIYRAMKKSSIVSSADRRAQEMAIARRLVYIVVTDFLCWFPIGILSILALSGVSFGGEVYAWTAVFILPVNSALNPFLYTIPAVIQRTMKRKQTSATKKSIEVSGTQPRVRIGDPDPGQILLEDALRQLVTKEDKVKLMKDIWEGMLECLMTRTADEPQPNAVFIGMRRKAVDSICLTTRADAPDTDLIASVMSRMNTHPDDEQKSLG